jgi:hypothetical protein
MSENRMTATPGYYPDGRYGEPDEPAPDDEYWDEDEPILATESELAYWRKRNQHRPATESEDRMTTHSLERTSPKGQPFVGYCVNCGMVNLPASAVFDACPNPDDVTQDDALIAAVTRGQAIDHHDDGE